VLPCVPTSFFRYWPGIRSVLDCCSFVLFVSSVLSRLCYSIQWFPIICMELILFGGRGLVLILWFSLFLGCLSQHSSQIVGSPISYHWCFLWHSGLRVLTVIAFADCDACVGFLTVFAFGDCKRLCGVSERLFGALSARVGFFDCLCRSFDRLCAWGL